MSDPIPVSASTRVDWTGIELTSKENVGSVTQHRFHEVCIKIQKSEVNTTPTR